MRYNKNNKKKTIKLSSKVNPAIEDKRIQKHI